MCGGKQLPDPPLTERGNELLQHDGAIEAAALSAQEAADVEHTLRGRLRVSILDGFAWLMSQELHTFSVQPRGERRRRRHAAEHHRRAVLGSAGPAA
jgi:hypothetical protein